MIGLIQLVTEAQVRIDNHIQASITGGIVALIGIEKTDNEAAAQSLINKILHFRIFPDENNKMNRSLIDVQGGLLLVPQFTLIAETNKGTRPGFSKGMEPEAGKNVFDYLVNYAKNNYSHIATGKFGSHMQINLCNDGPVTFILSS